VRQGSCSSLPLRRQPSEERLARRRSSKRAFRARPDRRRRRTRGGWGDGLHQDEAGAGARRAAEGLRTERGYARVDAPVEGPQRPRPRRGQDPAVGRSRRGSLFWTGMFPTDPNPLILCASVSLWFAFSIRHSPPNSAIEWFFLRWRRSHMGEGLCLLNGEGRLFRVPLAKPGGTLGLPFGAPPRSAGKARGASPHPWRILPPDPVRGRMPPIPYQVKGYWS